MLKLNFKYKGNIKHLNTLVFNEMLNNYPSYKKKIEEAKVEERSFLEYIQEFNNEIGIGYLKNLNKIEEKIEKTNTKEEAKILKLKKKNTYKTNYKYKNNYKPRYQKNYAFRSKLEKPYVSRFNKSQNKFNNKFTNRFGFTTATNTIVSSNIVNTTYNRNINTITKNNINMQNTGLFNTSNNRPRSMYINRTQNANNIKKINNPVIQQEVKVTNTANNIINSAQNAHTNMSSIKQQQPSRAYYKNESNRRSVIQGNTHKIRTSNYISKPEIDRIKAELQAKNTTATTEVIKRKYSIASNVTTEEKKPIISKFKTTMYFIKANKLVIDNINLGHYYYIAQNNQKYIINNVYYRKTILNKINIRSIVKEFNLHWHLIFKNSILERLINHCIEHGNKAKAENLIFKTLYWIKAKYHKRPMHILINGLINVMPFMETMPFRMGKNIKLLPKYIPVRRRVYMACAWIIGYAKPSVKNSTKAQQKPFYKKLALELLSSAMKKSRSFNRMIHLHETVFENRINANLARKFLHKRRKKKTIKIRKRRLYKRG